MRTETELQYCLLVQKVKYTALVDLTHSQTGPGFYMSAV